MKELTNIFNYEGNSVTFRNENGIVYVNLTEIAKAFPSKNLSEIVSSKELSEYIAALSEIENSLSLEYVRVIKGGVSNLQGTWAHQKVALRVAQKLSPRFAVWVDTKIEELMNTGVTTIVNDDETILRSIQILQGRIEKYKEQNLIQAEIIELQDRKIEEDEPKVEFFNDVADSQNDLSLQEAAQSLGTGRTRLVDFCVEKKLFTQYRTPYQQYLDEGDGRGYFKTKITTKKDRYGRVRSFSVIRITAKGLQYLHKLMKG